eukprot:TRINITY_DN2071_c0_g1_i10.p1 TRINITY_DN2071_c0_g1~~TRINITY_DN2071_c0_g1_i10.p1  ORF type:complete len:1093 (-),score=222.43 TRINITY_DN2071_c0_g1_i10:82-3360(-)
MFLNTNNHCPSFIFHNLLPTVHNLDSHFIECLQLAMSSPNYSTGSPTNAISTAHRMEKLSQGGNSNPVTHHKIPEHYIHVLKVEPTLSNLALLGNVLRTCGTTPQSIKWFQDFISLGGVGAILDVISINNRKSRTFEADTRVDLECLRILDVITSQSAGMEALFAVSVHPLNDVVLTLLNPNHSYNVKSFVFTLLSRVCAYSEAGYRCVMLSLDRLKEIKRDRVKFKFLVESLLIEQDSNYRATCMELINQIIGSPSSLSQRAKMKKEFVDLGILRITDLLSQDHTPALEKQLSIFSCHIDEDQMWFRTINLNDPLSLCKTIQDVLRVDQKDLMESFNCILRRVLSIISETEGNTKESLEMIEKFAGIVALQPKGTKLMDDENPSVNSFIVNNSRLINDFTQKFLPTPPSQPLIQNSTSTLSISQSNVNSNDNNSSSNSSTNNEITITPASPKVKSSAPPPPPMPPLPPPALRAKSSTGGPMPPPPPIPRKKVEAPTVPMKQLFWTKISAKNIPKTFWEPEVKSSEKSEPVTEGEALDKKELESLFHLPKKTNPSTPVGRSSTAVKEISVLDTKRFNNMGIMVARFKMTPQNVLVDLLGMDDSSLTREKVQAFTKCVPTQEEEGLLRSYSGERPLSNVDQVLRSMLSIPRVKERLECIYFHMQFESMMDEVTSTVANLDKACDSLMNGNNLKQFLQIILKVGNYMNGQSVRGDALGFKLNFLLNLSELKSADNKTTLLHYLALVQHRKHPESLKLIGEELKYAESLSRTLWKEILAQFEQIKSGMKKIEQELEILKKSAEDKPSTLQEQEDRFPQIMSKFLSKYGEQVGKLQLDLQNSDSKFTATSAYFGEEGVTPEDFFSLLRDFNSLLKKAQNDNEREKTSSAKKRTENRPPMKKQVDTPPVVTASSPKRTPLSPKILNFNTPNTPVSLAPPPTKYITPQKPKEPKETPPMAEKLTPSTPLEAEAMLLHSQLFKKNTAPQISPMKDFLPLPKSTLPSEPAKIPTFSLNAPQKTAPTKQFAPTPAPTSYAPPNATLFGFTKGDKPQPAAKPQPQPQPTIKTTSLSSEQSESSFFNWLKKKNPPPPSSVQFC